MCVCMCMWKELYIEVRVPVIRYLLWEQSPGGVVCVRACAFVRVGGTPDEIWSVPSFSFCLRYVLTTRLLFSVFRFGHMCSGVGRGELRLG